MKHLQTILSGLLAGILISLGGLVNVFLLSNSPASGSLQSIVGALMFSLGLLFICSMSLFLYTGKIGYVLDNKNWKYGLELVESLSGNIIGCILMGLITQKVRIFTQVKSTLVTLCQARTNDTWYSLLLLAFLCGIFVYLAVDIYKSNLAPTVRVVGLIMAVSAFVLLGCEHVIADIYYFCAAGIFNIKVFGILWLILLGNSLGSIFFHGIKKVILLKKKEQSNINNE